MEGGLAFRLQCMEDCTCLQALVYALEGGNDVRQGESGGLVIEREQKMAVNDAQLFLHQGELVLIPYVQWHVGGDRAFLQQWESVLDVL